MNNKKTELLGNAPIPKALLAMEIPTMIGMLVNAFYNLVDAYFVSGLSESQMGVISIYTLLDVVHPSEGYALRCALGYTLLDKLLSDLACCSATALPPISLGCLATETQKMLIKLQVHLYTAVFS